MKPCIVVIEGPSGVGKDTVARELVGRYGDKYIKMPSITDRAMRANESQGNPYFFVTTEEFKKKVASGDIFEFTVMARDNLHRGMSKQIIEGIATSGRIQLKDCDWVGIEALRKVYGVEQVLAICLTVSKEEIVRRINERGGDSEDIARRIADFDEYSKKIQGYCDVSVENLDLDKCVSTIHSMVRAKWNLK